jgi:hypothetical protein
MRLPLAPPLPRQHPKAGQCCAAYSAGSEGVVPRSPFIASDSEHDASSSDLAPQHSGATVGIMLALRFESYHRLA